MEITEKSVLLFLYQIVKKEIKAKCAICSVYDISRIKLSFLVIILLFRIIRIRI